MIDLQETAARRARVTQLMDQHDLDVLVVIDLSRDEVMGGHQRWLTGFVPFGSPAAALLYRDGSTDLLAQWLGPPQTEFYAGSEPPVTMVRGFSFPTMAERIGQRGAKRVGYVEAATFPYALQAALSALTPAPEIVDFCQVFDRLRLVKSPVELAAIRRSCAISDKVWGQAQDIFRVGRKIYEIVADVDHIIQREVGEGG